MRFTKLSLGEGQIKLPQKMLAALNKHAAENILSFYLQKLHYEIHVNWSTWGKDQKEAEETIREWYETTFAAIERISSRFGLSLSPTKNLSYPKSFSEPEQDLPSSYGDSHGEFQLRLLVDFDGKSFDRASLKSAGAYYDPDNELIVVNGHKLVTEYTGEVSLEQNDESLMGKLRLAQSHIRHELTHYIQFSRLQHLNAKQVGTNGYDSRKSTDDEFDTLKRYFTSQVEFDPTVKSSIDKLLNAIPFAVWKAMNTEQINAVLKKFILGTPGGIEIPMAGGAVQYRLRIPATPDFLKFLRGHDPKRWKKAVSLVVTGVAQELQKRFDISVKSDGTKISDTDIT